MYNLGLDTQMLTSSAGWSEPIKKGVALLMCGDCNNPAALHDDFGFEDLDGLVSCETSIESIGREDYDYFLHDSAGNITLYNRYEGNAANIESLISGVDNDHGDGDYSHSRIEDDLKFYDNGSRESDAIATWRDKDERICTHATDYWYFQSADSNCISGSYDGPRVPNGMSEFSLTDLISKEERSVYVEANAGFISRKVLDADLTRKHHAHLLNVFRDKRTGDIRVGSIRFTFANGNVTAECVRDTCIYKDVTTGDYRKCSITVSLDADRDVMEMFIYQVIKHGNNHAHNFIRSRADYYKLHNLNCDTNCGDADKPCNSNRRVSDNPVHMNEVEFLMDHQRYCSDANCACESILADMLPPSLIEKVA